ncbi:MAG TPA: hemolysin family protein [Polyangiaceae bacterium]
MDPASPLQKTIEFAVALVPAFCAAMFATATYAVGSLSGARRAALRETLTGRSRDALDRYSAHEGAIEARWLVLRVLGICGTALAAFTQLPPKMGSWRLLVTAVVVLSAYGIPSQIGRVWVARTAEQAAPFLLRFLRPFELIALPIAAPILWVANLLGRLVTRQPAQPKVTEAEVEIIVNEGELSGSLAHDQSEMIRNVLDFGSVTAGEVMVPRIHVAAFDVNTLPNELLRRIAETAHSRYPVYRGTMENVLGVLHVKDLITFAAAHDLKQLHLEDIVRKQVVFVPESQTASSVLRDMRAGRHHMAVVIDEFGGTSGIVTLEDLVEEIVGDIRDEHDIEEPPIMDLGEGRLMVDASVSIADLSRYLGADLPEGSSYNSLGGFLVAHFGRVPEPGARLNALGLEFLVRESDDRRVSKVEILRHTEMHSVPPRSSRSVSAA